MKDRIAAHPGRVRLTPVSGQENVYDMERADSPSQAGTPLNKETLLDDPTAERLGTEDMTPNDAMNAVIDESAFIVGDMIAGNDTMNDNWLVCDGSVVDKDEYPELYNLLFPLSKASTKTITVSRESNYSDYNCPLQIVNGYYVTFDGFDMNYKPVGGTNWSSVSLYQSINSIVTINGSYFKSFGIVYANNMYYIAAALRRGTSSTDYLYIFSTPSLSTPPTTGYSLISSLSFYATTRLYQAGEYYIIHGIRTMTDPSNADTAANYSTSFPNTGLGSFAGAEYYNNRWIVYGSVAETVGSTTSYYGAVAIGQIGKTAKTTSWTLIKSDSTLTTNESYRVCMYFSAHKKIYVRRGSYTDGKIIDISNDVPVDEGTYTVSGSVGYNTTFTERSATVGDWVHSSIGIFINSKDVSVEKALQNKLDKLTSDPGNTVADGENFRYWASNTTNADRNIWSVVKSLPSADFTEGVMYKIKAKSEGNIKGGE